MVIEIQLNDGTSTETRLDRNVKQLDYSSFVAGFYANKPNYKWGTLAILKGKARNVLHAFGKEF